MADQKLLYVILLLSITLHCYGTQELLRFSDIKGLGTTSRNFVRTIIGIFNVRPDGISLNYENAGHAHGITAKYGRWCWKTLGTTKYMVEKTRSTTAIVGSTHAINHDSEAATIKVVVSSKWTDSAEVSTSISAGMTFKSEFAIEGLFKSGLDFEFKVGSGTKKTKTFERSISSEVEVHVPPRSKKEVKVIAHNSKGVLHFRTPIDVHGTVGVNYSHRVHGHYFWFFDIRRLVPRTSGEISGQVTGTKVVNTDIDIGKAQPLQGNELEEALSKAMDS